MTTLADAMADATAALNEAAAQYFSMYQAAQAAINAAAELTIVTYTTKTVHGAGADFADLNAALDWLSRRRISASGFVLFQLAQGYDGTKLVYAQDIVFAHPDWERVTIQGQGLNGPMPQIANFAANGNGAVARQTDTANNLVLLRGVMRSEIYFTAGKRFVCLTGIGNLNEVLFTNDGTGVNDAVLFLGGLSTLRNVVSVGSANHGIRAQNCLLALNGLCIGMHAGGNGILADSGGKISVSGKVLGIANAAAGLAVDASSSLKTDTGSATASAHATCNGGDGFGQSNGSSIAVSSISTSYGNGGAGFAASYGGAIYCSGCASSANDKGFYAVHGAYIHAGGTTGGNTSFGYIAFNGAQIYRTSGTASGGTVASPAAGSNGNSNAFII